MQQLRLSPQQTSSAKLLGRFADLNQFPLAEGELRELFFETRQNVQLSPNSCTRNTDRFSRLGTQPQRTAPDQLGKLNVKSGKHTGATRSPCITITVFSDAA
ncbi:hypothetical protein KKK_02400 [Pseudomonas putida B6-2]|nr:hypothetical protein KKK_02400 [Pseudomonas putida B6-2]